MYNAGASAVTNLTFYWIGVKLFPWGAVPGYTYPKRMAGLSFAYPVQVANLGVSELRLNQVFTVKPDADMVIRAGQARAPFQSAGPRTLAEVGITLRDFNKKPYSNDFVPVRHPFRLRLLAIYDSGRAHAFTRRAVRNWPFPTRSVVP